MSSQAFIFSNHPAYRISRHTLFWMCWLLICYCTIWLPNHSRVFEPFFSSWNVEELLQRIDKRGGWYSSLVPQFFTRFYHDFLGHIIITYSIIYIALPGCFSRKKNRIFIASLPIAGVFVYLYTSFYNNFADGVKQGIRTIIPDHWYLIAVMAKGLAFTLPTVVGFAVAIKLLKRWWLKQKETEQLAREKATAELQLLKAQIHPHFLFNTLNNIYFFTLSASTEAPEMIKKLSDMLRYILNECDRATVPLEKEIKMIQDYMTLEKFFRT